MFLALVQPIDIIYIPLSLSLSRCIRVYVARFLSRKFLSLIFTRASARVGGGAGGGEGARSAMT